MYYVYAGVVTDIFKIVSQPGQIGGVGLFLLGAALAGYVSLQIYKFVSEKQKEDDNPSLSVYKIKNNLSQIKEKLEELEKVSEVENDIEDIQEDVDKIDKIYSLVRELHSWHDKEDQRGRKVWYVQFTMKEIINDVLEGVNDMMHLIEKLVEDVDEIQQKQRKEDNNES